MAIDYRRDIPNNVGLDDNRALQRALEHWQPRFLDWWREMGPTGFAPPPRSICAPRSRSTRRAGPNTAWSGCRNTAGASFLPNRSRTGNRLWRFFWRAGVAPGSGRASRQLASADRHPGRHRARFGRAAASARADRPSLYDLRNLFQVNVEEGRHLWAMVYLLHAYFGRDGREEAEELLSRHSGDPDKPRILAPSTSRSRTG